MARKLALFIISLALMGLSTIHAGEVFTATLHLILRVPEPPITEDIPDGNHGNYTTHKDGNVLCVTAR